MKLIYLLLTIFLFNIYSVVYSQQITYSAKNVPLKTVFAVIQKQTGYGFFYDQTLLSRAKPVSLAVTNASLQNVLGIVFKYQPLEYSIENKTILVSKKSVPNKTSVKQKSPATKAVPFESATVNTALQVHPISSPLPEKQADTILLSNKISNNASSIKTEKSEMASAASKDSTGAKVSSISTTKLPVISPGNTTVSGKIQSGQITSSSFKSQPDFQRLFFNRVFGPLETEKVTFGVKGGFTTSRQDGWQKGSGSSDFYFGFFADKQMTSKFHLGTELTFALLGRTNQYEIPVHAKYSLNERWNVLTGPKLDIMGYRYGSRKYVGVSAEVGSQYQINQIFFAEARFAHRLIAQDINFLRLGIGANFTRNESIENRSDKPEPLRLRVGLNGGAATTNGFGPVAGIDLRIQENLSSFAAGTLTVGFSHYWRDPDYIEYLNYFPVKAGLKLFPVSNFYVAPEAGFAFGLERENDSRPFVYAAGIGVQLKNGFDVSLRYEKISGQIGTYYMGMPVVKNPAYFALRAEYGINFRQVEGKTGEFREAKEPPAWRGTHKKSVFLELMGHGMGVTGNFDMRFRRDQNDGLGFSAGAGFIDKNFTLPLTLNYIVGKRRSGLEAGIGVTGLISESSNDNFFWGGSETKESFMAVGVVSLGYRLQSYSGFMLRANLTAVYDGLYYNKFFHPDGLFYIHIPGLSIGYTFR